MKKIFILAVVLLVMCNVFTQSAKSAGVSDSDVKNWAKNCVLIQEELEKADIDPEDTLSIVKNEKQTAQKILQKYGISNPDPFQKYSVILQCAGILKTESQLDEQSKTMMKLMKVDPLGELKKNINSRDYDTVATNSKVVLKALDDLNEHTSSVSREDSEEEDYSDFSSLMNAYGVNYSDYESKEDRIKKDVLKKYDVKKKFKVVKGTDGMEWIIVQPSDITFKNSTEAEIYAENYSGVKGVWTFCSSCGYCGETSSKDSKTFYTWVNGGVGCYLKFPIDFDSCAPDKIIEDKDVTPEIAKKTVLQMYRAE